MNTIIESLIKAPAAPVSHSRRGFLGRAMVGGVAGLLLSATKPFGGVLHAAEDPSDIDILNYALTLEHLEYAFYRDGLATLSRGKFMSARFIKNVGSKVAKDVYEYLGIIRDHEDIHVDTLITVITSLDGTPVQELNYDFGYTNADRFIAVAQDLENTGVMAYTGALALIDDPDLQTAGATIATVEARHASYLNLLNGEVPFPDAFDTPKTMDEILAIAGQFIVS